MKYDLLVRNIEVAGKRMIADTTNAFLMLSQLISASSVSTNGFFPFVTVPGFEILGEYARRLSRVEMIVYTPIVQESQASRWQEYAFDNQGWIQESREAVRKSDDIFFSSNYVESNITPLLWQNDENGSVIPAFSKPFLPIWQVSSLPRIMCCFVAFISKSDCKIFCFPDFSSAI